MKLINKLFIFIILIFITACDGYRVVQLTNLSKSNIYLETDYPHRIEYHQDPDNKKDYKEVLNNQWGQYFMRSNSDLKIDTVSGGLRILLKPNQVFNLVNGIGPATGKIQPKELYYSKLKIFTQKDTIVANDRVEILSLTENSMTKYNNETDKSIIVRDNNRWKNIIIRE